MPKLVPVVIFLLDVLSVSPVRPHIRTVDVQATVAKAAPPEFKLEPFVFYRRGYQHMDDATLAAVVLRGRFLLVLRKLVS